MSGYGFRYRLTLVDPVLAGGGASDPNAIATLHYIPGAIMRGVAASNRGPFDAGTEESQLLLFGGAVRFLHAYPAIGSGQRQQRAEPTPRSWIEKVARADETPERNRTALDLAYPGVDPDEDRLYREPGELFSVRDQSRAWVMVPEREPAIRTRWSRKKRRAVRGEGAVFLYDPLAAGQTFEGAVVAETEALACEALALLPEGSVFLGRTKGEAVLSHASGVEPVGRDGLPGRSEGSRGAEDLPAGRYALMFRSHAVLRDRAGDIRPTATVAAAALSDLIEVPVEVIGAYVSEDVAGGFNAHMGLPLRREPALAMGSVVTVKIPKSVDAATLASALVQGLGERTAEGHGHFELISLDAMQKKWVPTKPEKSDSNPAPPLSAEQHPVSHALAERLVRRVIHDRALRPVRTGPLDEAKRFGGLSASQRGRLRTVLEAGSRVGGRAGAQSVLDFLDALTVRTRIKQYEWRAQPTTPTVLAWLRGLFSPLCLEGMDPSSAPVWKELAVANETLRMEIGGVSRGEDDLATPVSVTFDLALAALRQAPPTRTEAR